MEITTTTYIVSSICFTIGGLSFGVALASHLMMKRYLRIQDLRDKNAMLFVDISSKTIDKHMTDIVNSNDLYERTDKAIRLKREMEQNFNILLR